MVFRKTRVEDRKNWLNALNKNTYMDYAKAKETGVVNYSDFINKEFILFSTYDNERSIPHVMDGFKPSQRKVLFACFKRNLKNEIKVAQLTGFTAEHAAYHHGEVSLQGTIVGMAQNFVGSNNINLLTPSGQFGTRRLGGKDAASARYIFTKLEPITRTIFHPDDDDLLDYLNDDGTLIEPSFYVPVIPMVLVNGSDGIGTGWSSTVLNYNPRDIVANLRRKIAGEPLEPMKPYYSGFTGDIDAKAGGKFEHSGKIERLNDTTLLISELPIKTWTQSYKQFLEGMMLGDAKKGPEIKDFRENHTDSSVSFTISAEASMINEFESDKNGLLGKFKLTGSLSTSNMCLFDNERKIAKYANPEDILNDFFQIRVEFYVKRKNLLVENLKYEQRMLSNRARFVEEVCKGDLVVSNRKRKELLPELQERGYDTFHKDPKKKEADGENSDEEDAEGSDLTLAELSKGYEYLLGMKIWSLTFEKAEKLRAELAEKTGELEELEATEPCQLWLDDLAAVEEALDERDVEFKKMLEEEKRAQQKSKKRQAKASKKKGKGRKKKADEWDSDLESSDEDDVGFDSDDSAHEKKPAAKGKKKAEKSAKKKHAEGTICSVLRESALATNPNPFAATRRETAKASTKSSAAVAQASSSDGDESGELSLMERMQKKLLVSPPQKAKKVEKRPSPKMQDVEDLMDTSTDSPKGKAKVVQDRKKKAVFSVDEDSEMELDKEDIVVKAKKPAPARRATKKALEEDDEEEESFDMDSSSSDEDEERETISTTRSRRARATTGKRVNYADSEDEDEDSDSDCEFD